MHEKNLDIYETPIYFRNIDYLLIIIFRMGIYICHSILVKKFQLLRVHQNGFYSYFGGFKHLVCYNLIISCSLDPVLVIWNVIQWYFSKLKKVNLVC